MRNLPPWALAAIVVGLAALAVIIAFTGAAAASPCRVDGVAPFVAPDNGCTPGAFVPKTRHDVCDGDTDRPSLPAAERRAMLRNYGVPGWTAADGEIDHRVPLVLGGTTDRRNLWPEAGPDPRRGQNQKDRLEAAIYRRVCFGVPYAMRVRTAVLLFMSDWRPAYTYYVLGIGPRVLPR